MKKKHLLTVLLCLTFVFISATTTLTGRVVGVIDGDSITLLKDNQTIKIRLHGIDCPERGQDYGTRAKQFTSGMCYGKNVTVIVRDTDHYGRQVGEVILDDGTNLNQSILAEGLGWWYEKYAPRDSVLATLEHLARQHSRGLWKLPNPIPPWEFRHGSRGSSSPTNAETKGCEYWLNTNSNVRHNSSCKWFENTSYGRCCDSTEGKACGMCGG
ncbi:MAG: thermonuclease family protein [Chitinivibrionales bacterium]